MEYSYDIEVLKKSANDFTEKINLDNCRKFAKELDEKLEALSWRRSTDNLTTHKHKWFTLEIAQEIAEQTVFRAEQILYSCRDLFNGCINLGYSETDAKSLCVQYVGMINAGYRVHPSDFLDAIRKVDSASDSAFMPDTIVYPAMKNHVTSSATGFTPAQKPKKKRPQKRKPKPKNRTVYR